MIWFGRRLNIISFQPLYRGQPLYLPLDQVAQGHVQAWPMLDGIHSSPIWPGIHWHEPSLHLCLQCLSVEFDITFSAYLFLCPNIDPSLINPSESRIGFRSLVWGRVAHIPISWHAVLFWWILMQWFLDILLEAASGSLPLSSGTVFPALNLPLYVSHCSSSIILPNCCALGWQFPKATFTFWVNCGPCEFLRAQLWRRILSSSGMLHSVAVQVTHSCAKEIQRSIQDHRKAIRIPALL